MVVLRATPQLVFGLALRRGDEGRRDVGVVCFDFRRDSRSQEHAKLMRPMPFHHRGGSALDADVLAVSGVTLREYDAVCDITNVAWGTGSSVAPARVAAAPQLRHDANELSGWLKRGTRAVLRTCEFRGFGCVLIACWRRGV